MTRKASETTKDGVKTSLSKLCSPEYNNVHFSCRHFHYEGNCGCKTDLTTKLTETVRNSRLFGLRSYVREKNISVNCRSNAPDSESQQTKLQAFCVDGYELPCFIKIYIVSCPGELFKFSGKALLYGITNQRVTYITSASCLKSKEGPF
jgi:hypothetical protein